MLAVLAVVTTAACRERRPPAPVMPPLGPGPTVELNVPGATALEPVIASNPPLVAIAFATRDPRGPMIYLTTSDDNGATFNEPQPMSGPTPAARYDKLGLSFVSSAGEPDGSLPVLKLEWQSPDGQVQSHTVQPWNERPRATALEPPKPGPTAVTTITSCSASGEAWLIGAEDLSVPINHSLSEEACVPGEVAAVTDSRRWIHAVWIGRAVESADPRVFYASSPHGNGFGFSQVLADNRPGPSHLRVVTDPNETVVTVWDQASEGRKEVWLRQVIPSHLGPGALLPLTRLSGAAGGESPALASIRGGVIAAWVVPGSGALAIRRVGLDALCAEPPTHAPESPATLMPPASDSPAASGERK